MEPKGRTINWDGYVRGWVHCTIFISFFFMIGAIVLLIKEPGLKYNPDKLSEAAELTTVKQLYYITCYQDQFGGYNKKRQEAIVLWVLEFFTLPIDSIKDDYGLRAWVQNIRNKAGKGIEYEKEKK